MVLLKFFKLSNFSACKEIKCDFYGHKECEPHYQLINASCICMRGWYEQENGACATEEKIIAVTVNLGIAFLKDYDSFKVESTIKLRTRLETQIIRQLQLNLPSRFIVTRLMQGSVIAEGLVLLPKSTTENKTSIGEKLVNELRMNTTGLLQEFNLAKINEVSGMFGCLISSSREIYIRIQFDE